MTHLFSRLGVALLTLAAPTVAAQYAAASLPTGLADVGFMAAPVFVDLDADGDLDVLAGRAAGDIVYFENTGTATAPAFTERTGTANPAAGIAFAAVTSLAAGDVTGDRRPDLIVGEIDGQVNIYRDDGPGADPRFVIIFGGPVGLPNLSPSVADLDGDGDTDLLAGQVNGTLVPFLNDGTRAAPSFAGTETPVSFDGLDVGFSSAPLFADLDGDGDLDLLVGDVDGGLSVATNTAPLGDAPVFGALVADGLGVGDLGYGSVPALGDLDGDGDLDLLVGRSDGTFVYFTNEAPVLTTTLGGPEGWRLIATPVGDATLASFLNDDIWTQGPVGSDVPGGPDTIYRYLEPAAGAQGNGYVAVNSMAEQAGAGLGLYVYVYADDDPNTPGEQGGFPKPLDAPTGDLQTGAFTWDAGTAIPLTYTDTGNPAEDGWNLLGNPYAGWFDWDVTSATGLADAVYVYDGAAASYLAYSRGVGGALPGGVVGAFQGFWVQTTATAPTLTAEPALASSGPTYKAGDIVRLALHLTDGSDARAQTLLAFGPGANGLDAADAYRLASPALDHLVLGSRADGPSRSALAVDVRPMLEMPAEIDLDLDRVAGGASVGGAVRLDWPDLDLPDNWDAALVDRRDGSVTDLRDVDGLDLVLGPTAFRRATDALTPTTPTAKTGSEPSRFAIRIGPGALVADEDAPTSLALGAPFPNPASTRASLALDLPDAATVTAEAFDVLGRRIATLADGAFAAGRHTLHLDLGSLGAGTYVVRVAVGGEVMTRRVTVAR